MHIPYKTNKRLTGTARYTSLNTHMGIEQSRRDDLECLAFSLVYLLKGSLPWQGLRAENKAEKYQKILERKKAISIDMMCKGLPNDFGNMFYYCRSLKFEDKPDYALLKKRFADSFYSGKYNKNFEYDWSLLKLDLNTLLDRVTSTEESHKEEDEEEEKEATPADKEGKKEEQKEPKKKKPNNSILMRLSSAPNRLKLNFLKKKEPQPYCFISKRIKEIRQEFLRKNQAPDEGISSIIPYNR